MYACMNQLGQEVQATYIAVAAGKCFALLDCTAYQVLSLVVPLYSKYAPSKQPSADPIGFNTLLLDC